MHILEDKLQNCKESNQLIRSLDRKYVKTKKTGYKKSEIAHHCKDEVRKIDELCQQQ